ncbi:glycosyl transferase family 2 [Lentzea flaviverrucosa]|uniref:Glycosyl transferase family 2 n=1 Tax=Lentzea flaviverrucosa TaxID=200379 RepID=A0A1H9XWM5_9PSEU|nr:glycosyl transferase family 2 [Lentzea flaviverrucosa]SES50083.1 Glycosyl transferase family 2 [Lentzea flaviverrucosa]
MSVLKPLLVRLLDVSDSVDLRRVLIVLPALNEEHNIEKVIAEVKAALPDVGVLVVDDGSTDQTSLRARESGARVARLAVNLGVGGAMRTGFRYAVRNGFEVVVQVDSDGQHNPAHVPDLLRELEQADIAIGARFAGKGDYKARGPRRWAMKLFAVVISAISGTKLTDVTSGFKASGPRAVRLFASHYPAEYLGDTLEALVMAARADLKIVQVPVEMRVRAGGTPSTSPVKSAVYLLRATLALTLALVRRKPKTGSFEAA